MSLTRADARFDDGLVPRHRLATRIWHWVNALAVLVMLMSGLMIFNAHPRLYWGAYGANADPAWLEIGSSATQGVLKVGPVTVETTGLLGRWTDGEGRVQRRAFPGWATIPSYYSLASARRWHLAFAWVLALGLLAHWLASLLNGHARRDLAPRRGEFGPRSLWHDVRRHARLHVSVGAAGVGYNSLQKLAYLAVLALLLPLLIVTGIGMSPGLNAAWTWLPDLLGGRQSARSIHFLCAAAIAVFILVHLVMVVVAGPWNELRAMITGRYRPPRVRGGKTMP